MQNLFAGARAFLGLSLACVTGCSGGAQDPPHTGAGGSGSGSGSGGEAFSEAPHSPLPQLVYQGGALLTAPSIVTVTFPDDTNAAALEEFDDSIVLSPWWDTVTSGFCNDTDSCVGAGASGGHVRLTTPAAASYADATGGGTSTLQFFIADQISQGLFPAPSANTLYVLYFPAATVITLTESFTQPATSCTDFHGYHGAVTSGGVTTPYVVVPECPPADGSNLTQIQSFTFAASHEIVEATTDPVQTSTSLGYYLNLSDSTVLGWNLLSGGEAADLCVDVSGLHQDETTTEGYTVQRIWSNANAVKGLDPCIPAASATAPDLYFNVAPAGSSAYLVLDIGESVTFEGDAFSTGPTSSWTLEGIDGASAEHGLHAPLLSFTFNGQKTATVNNGDKVQITVTLDADPEAFGGAEGILLSVGGSLTTPTAAHPWPILVVTPEEADGGGT